MKKKKKKKWQYLGHCPAISECIKKIRLNQLALWSENVWFVFFFRLQYLPSLNQNEATGRVLCRQRVGRRLPSSLPVPFDPDSPLTNDAHDAILGGGSHPGEIPSQPEL